LQGGRAVVGIEVDDNRRDIVDRLRVQRSHDQALGAGVPAARKKLGKPFVG